MTYYWFSREFRHWDPNLVKSHVQVVIKKIKISCSFSYQHEMVDFLRQTLVLQLNKWSVDKLGTQ